MDSLDDGDTRCFDISNGLADSGVVEGIPDSYYLPAGTLAYPHATSDPTSMVEVEEQIFVALKPQAVDYSLVLTGTEDGQYKLVITPIKADVDDIEVSSLSSEIRKGQTHCFDFVLYPNGEITITGLPAIIDIDPDTLNLKSKGKWITCYVELPEGYDVSDIDVDSILLEGLFMVQKSDVQGETLMVKFNRKEIVDYIGLIPSDSVTLGLVGQLVNGTAFGGEDTIRLRK